jgi:hypothetical protein
LLDRAVVDRLGVMRGPGESYSDVILRIAAQNLGPSAVRLGGGTMSAVTFRA